MAQRSQPQGGYFNAVTLPDSGPYSANEWAALLGVMQRAGVVLSTVGPLQVDTAFNDTGVFYAVDNQLEVTSAGANTININTGAAMVAGRLVPSDTALVFTVPSSRTNDLIVVRQNWSAATYVPPGSVDADEEVPPNTARVTRVTALVNDATLATYWDTPLADFTTDGAGAVTLNSDDRVWVDAETKTYFEPVTNAWNVTDGASNTCDIDSYFVLLDNKSVKARGTFLVPNDFISSLTVKAVVLPFGSANIYVDNAAEYGACGEDYAAHSAVFGISAIAVTGDFNNCICEISLASATVGDIVRLQFNRNATNVLDTLNSDAYVAGWIVEYLGWGRR